MADSPNHDNGLEERQCISPTGTLETSCGDKRARLGRCGPSSTTCTSRWHGQGDNQQVDKSFGLITERSRLLTIAVAEMELYLWSFSLSISFQSGYHRWDNFALVTDHFHTDGS